jgi:hypothetical protein
VHETAALGSKNAVVGIIGGVLGRGGTKGRALLHASVDEIDAVSVASFHASEPGQDVFLLADSLFRPFDREIVIAGKGFDPVAAVLGALTKDLLGDRRHMQDLTEEVDSLFWPGEAADVSVDDNAIEAVLYQSQ